MKRSEYKFLGRLHRATWKKMEYDEQFTKWANFKRRIRSFLDTPRCMCPDYCNVHINDCFRGKQEQ